MSRLLVALLALGAPLSTFAVALNDTQRGWASAPHDPYLDTLSKRANVCAGVDLRARSGLAGKVIDPSDCTRAAKASGFNAYYAYAAPDGKSPAPKLTKAEITSATDPKSAKVVMLKRPTSNADKAATRILGPFNSQGGFQCDHVLEINVVQKILSSGGACDQAEKLTKVIDYQTTDPRGKPLTIQVTEGQSQILQIRDILAGPTNLIGIHNRIEAQKAPHTDQFNLMAPLPHKLFVKAPMDFLAMTDYVIGKTADDTLRVAHDIDAAIGKFFPGATQGVSARQIIYLSYTRTMRGKALALVEAARRANGCGAGAPASPTKPKTVVKRSGSFSSAFSPVQRSSLELQSRVVKAPRAGKKAPGAPCCPLKNAPQKKVVPASKAPIKAKPTTKPRRPAKRPATRPPNPKKKQVKRPASRARRAPGKQATRKRVTPKRKPKVVPKPTRRPKAKPRTRKRK